MASPISKSPRIGRRSPSPRSPRYKFTILPPDVYAPVTIEYSPTTDKSYRFCNFLKSKFESHFGMRCSLPMEAGAAFIGDFDQFERRFLVDSEYVVIIVTEKSVLALKKFYPRLLVFVTVRPEWVNRFILVFVGDVALDPSIDFSVLIHQPVTFKESDWEADLETWKALHRLLKVEWTPYKDDEPSPTRRGEVVSIIQRTVVETEVQEVRTRRRSSSRNSDNGSSTPATLSPFPGASRKLLSPTGDADLHIVSPSLEKPNIVEEMPGGRRHFGGRPEVEATRPVIHESPPPSSSEQTSRDRPQVVIERPDNVGAASKSQNMNDREKQKAENVQEVSEGKISPGEKSRPKQLITNDLKRGEALSPGETLRSNEESARQSDPKELGAMKMDETEKVKGRLSDKRDSWKFASEVRTRKPKDKLSDSQIKRKVEDKKDDDVFHAAAEESIVASKGRTLMASRGGKSSTEAGDDTQSKREAEISQDSVQTSGYSSLNSSMSTRSAVQSPPASLKLSPAEDESSTDVSYVTAPETLSLPTPQVVSLSPTAAAAKEMDSPDNSELTSLASENVEKPETQVTKPNMRATQISPVSLGRSAVEIAVALGKLFQPSESADNQKRSYKIPLLLFTATALSPIYRDMSMSFFGMLSSFLWPPLGAIESGALNLLPVAELAADASTLITDIMPLTTISIVSPTHLRSVSPTEVLTPTKFVFWVASPPS